MSGQRGVVINDGSMVIKDQAGYEIVSVGDNNGSYGMTVYGATPHTTTSGAKTAVTLAEGKVFTYTVATTAGNRAKLKRTKFVITI